MINKIKNYAIITLIICALLHLVSCAGTRKVNKSDTTEKVKTEITDNSKTETKTDTNIKIIDCTDTDEITIVPVDNTKEIIVNGKTYKNVYLKHRKVKNNITTNEVEKVAKIEQKAVSVKEETKKSVAVKQTESTKGNFWNWVLLIICITAFIFFVIWSRKYVKKESGEV
jgi:hypothetical protein